MAIREVDESELTFSKHSSELRSVTTDIMETLVNIEDFLPDSFVDQQRGSTNPITPPLTTYPGHRDARLPGHIVA